MSKKQSNTKPEPSEEPNDQQIPSSGEANQEPEHASQTAPLEIDLDALREEVEGILKERDEYLRMLTQVSADFENYKKRNAQLRSDVEADTRRSVVSSMLPVLDNLERALQSAAENQVENEGLRKGVEMVQKQFLSCLEALGVEEIPAQPGTPFDPAVHDAVATVPAEDKALDNTVHDVLQKGYRIGEKIIRHSMVRVAQK